MRTVQFKLLIFLLLLTIFSLSKSFAALIPGEGLPNLAPHEALQQETGSVDYNLNPNRPSFLLPAATPKKSKYKEGELIIKFKKNTLEKDKKKLHDKVKSKKIKEFKKLNLQHIKLEKGLKVKDAIKKYKKDSRVEYAEPNYLYETLSTPTDPLFDQLWGLQNTGQTGGTPGADIEATLAWDAGTGSNNVVVAVIDTGIDYAHEDLTANLWENPTELAGSAGVDDDGNGYIDDIYGVNTILDNGDPFDDHGHGTHVAGTIGAVSNNGVGVVGVNWNVDIVTCRFLNSGGGTTANAVECLEYVKDLKDSGVNIVATNNSWGGGGYSQALYDAIDAQRDILFIAAAGNQYSNNDKFDYYPANYDLPNVITVAATDSYDNKASFSNYGRHSVDVGAPGKDILSSIPLQNAFGYEDIYGLLSGTSMATPHVTGLAALLKAQDGTRDWKEIKNLILSGGDTIPSMEGKTITGKRINAFGSQSCTDSSIFSALKFPSTISVGTPTTLSALSINCGIPAGPVTVTTALGEVITLLDDGVAPDSVAGEGIFTGTWTPLREGESLTFESPAGTDIVTVPPLTPEHHLPEGNTHFPYSHFLEAQGGLPPYTWSVLSGNLPPGLSLNGATGEISGTPTATGHYDLEIQVQDGFQIVSSKIMSIKVHSDLLTQNWQKFFDGGDDDHVKHLVKDGNGYVYVTGSTFNGSNYDFKIIKYDPSGNVAWERTYDKGSHDLPRSIAMDSDNNIYVTGLYYYGVEAIHDFLTLKYDSNGNFLWEHARSSGRDTYVAGIETDNSGNVYVVGSVVTRSASYENIVIIKYGPSGQELWAVEYDGPSGFNLASVDFSSGIGIDKDGYIYVCGQTAATNPSTGGTIYYDRLLLKYDSSGILLWSRTYSAEDGSDYSGDIIVDEEGNIYTSGVSASMDLWGERYFLILKYDPSGNLLWFKKYDPILFNDFGANLEVDDQNNLYMGVTKLVEGVGYYYHVVKYESSGNTVWFRDFSAGNDDHLRGFAVDGDFDIILSGSGGYQGSMYDFFTVKFSEHLAILTLTLPDGAVDKAYSQTLAAKGDAAPLSWSITAGALPPGLVFNNASGEISGVPTSAGTYDFTVQLVDNLAIAVTKDISITITAVNITTPSTLPAGSVGYGFGESLTAEGGAPPYTWSVVSGALPDGLILNSSTGQISGTPVSGGLFSFTVQVSDANSETATKAFSVSIFGIQTSSLASTSVGVPYSQYLTAIGGTPPYAWAITTGELPAGLSLNNSTGEISGTPLIGGNFEFTIEVTDGQSVSLAKTLTIQAPVFAYEWSRVYDEAALNNYAHAIAIDGSDNIFVTGDSYTGTFSYEHYRNTIKYDSAGNVISNIKFEGDPHGPTYGIALDQGGNAYVAGYGNIWPGGNDYLLIKYDSSANFEWMQTYNGTGNNSDTAYGVATDSSGNVYLAGKSWTGSGYEFRTIKYNQSGNVIWNKGYTDQDFFDSSFGSIAVDNSGNAYVSGRATNGLQTIYKTIKYDPWGNMFWSKNYFLGSTNIYTRHGIAVDSNGSAYIAGHNAGNSLVIKYDKDGNEIWSRTRSSGSEEVLFSVAVDPIGNVYAAGYTTNELDTDYLVLKYDAAGNLSYVKVFNGGGDDRAEGIALDSSGNVYVTGYSHTGTKNQYLTIKYNQEPTLPDIDLPRGTVGVSYSQNLNTFGAGPLNCAILSGNLPEGLSLNSTTGEISGAPLSLGTFDFTVKVTDVNSNVAVRSYSIEIDMGLAIATSSLSSGSIGTPYSQILAGAGGVPPYSWSLSGGFPGLTINPLTGELSGTPGQVGSYSIGVSLSDSDNSSVSQQFTLVVDGLLCGNSPTQIGGIPYNSIQEAYTGSSSLDTIEIQAQDFVEDLIFDRDVSISLEGGYNCVFSDPLWESVVSGSLRIRGGKVIIKKMVFR